MLVRKPFMLLIGSAFAVFSGFAEKPVRPSGHEQLPGWATNTLQNLQYGVLIEVEGFHSKVGGENNSDFYLATAAFDLEASMNDWLRGHVGLLWEQYSRETDNIDEAYIALGASDEIPFYLVAGRFYQPVGNFESAFISDPLPLELIEMNTESAMLGVGNGWGDLNIGAFKGDVKQGAAPESGGDSTISDFFASVTVTPGAWAKFGAYWLSDMMEGYNQKALGKLIADQPGYDRVDAAGAFINAYLGRITLNAEFVSALADFRLTGGTYRPTAFNVEGSVQIHEKIAVGLKYEGSHDLYSGFDRSVLMLGDKLPGRAAGAVVSYAFHEAATVAVEYLHVAELDNDDSGDVVAVQLGLAF